MTIANFNKYIEESNRRYEITDGVLEKYHSELGKYPTLKFMDREYERLKCKDDITDEEKMFCDHLRQARVTIRSMGYSTYINTM